LVSDIRKIAKLVLSKINYTKLICKTSGDNSNEVTPVPISNTVVKLISADDTWRAAAWESRTSPVLQKREVMLNNFSFLCDFLN
jgi:hypothetical protein